MRANSQQQHMRAARKWERDSEAAENLGLIQVSVDSVGEDGTVEVEGKTLINMGSCSYLGLNRRPELIEAAVGGVRSFGVSYSSSRTYSSLGLYQTLESLLSEITTAPVIVTGSTTLAHLAALPAIVEHNDIVAIDAQAHASLHLACSVLSSRGVSVETIPHNDLAALRVIIERAPARVWYVADSIYSMFGDIGPIAEIRTLMDEHPALHSYLDDAHGFGWAGENGRGLVLDGHRIHERMIVSASLSKTFGAGGGLLICPDETTRKRLLRTGGTLTFGGPVQTAELAAGVAAAEILLSDEHPDLQRRLTERFETVIATSTRVGVRLAATAPTPVWFAEIGPLDEAIEVTLALREAGFLANVSGFPIVPHGRAGIRFTTTLAQTPTQLTSFLEAIGEFTTVRTSIELDLTERAEVDRGT